MQWVYNVLEHRAEVERIIYEDPHPETGFILAPDMKWPQDTMDTLYLLATVHVHNIKSVRSVQSMMLFGELC